MVFLKVFSIVLIVFVLISIYQQSNIITCKNYMKCIMHTTSGRVIVLALLVSLSVVNKYLAALVLMFLSIFLFDLKEKYGVFDLYNCEVMDKNIQLDTGITTRLEEKINKRKEKDTIAPLDGNIISTPSCVLTNTQDNIPMFDIKTIGNVKFEY